MDFLMYFDFVYGILFDGRIITRKTRKSHRNTENKKDNRGDDVYRPPSPHTESTEINGIHEKGAGAGFRFPPHPLHKPGGEAFEYTPRRFAFSFFACGLLRRSGLN